MKLRSISLLLLLAAAAGCQTKQPGAVPPLVRTDLLFTSTQGGSTDLWLWNATTGEQVNLTNHSAYDNWGVWSHDGSQIAFQRRDGEFIDIWTMNADGSGQTRLTDSGDHDYLPCWSADDRQIYFSSWRQEPDEAERMAHYYVMDADGSNQRRWQAQSPGGSSGLVASPRGDYVVVGQRNVRDNQDLFLARTDGTLVRQLTESGPYFSGAHFSPDGSRIACYASDDRRARLLVLQVDWGESAYLPVRGKCWYPSWTADGAWLCYTAPEDETESSFRLYAIDASGLGAPIDLLPGPGSRSEGRWRPAAQSGR